MDVLIAEFIAAAAWMNPFYWIMKNELKAVHEFAADDYAAKQAGNLTYTEHLITEAIFQKQLQLVNPFFNDQFKRRLAMLTQKTNSSKGRYNKWIAIPLFIATAIFFVISCQKKDVFNEQGNNSPSPSLQQTVKNPEIDARYSGDWARFLQTNLRGDIPVENGAGPGNYQVIAQFVVDVDGTVSNVKILKDPGYGMGSETVRVIAASGRWTPAMQNGKPVKAYRKQPITFQVTEG
ncbi:energy transducer TonB [Niabella sp. 3A5MI-3]|nr:energy transducer TonB [Niabella beijingensis]